MEEINITGLQYHFQFITPEKTARGGLARLLSKRGVEPGHPRQKNTTSNATTPHL